MEITTTIVAHFDAEIQRESSISSAMSVNDKTRVQYRGFFQACYNHIIHFPGKFNVDRKMNCNDEGVGDDMQ